MHNPPNIYDANKSVNNINPWDYEKSVNKKKKLKQGTGYISSTTKKNIPYCYLEKREKKN